RAERLEGANATEELNGLQLAAEAHLEAVAKDNAVGTGERYGLERGGGHGIEIGRIKAKCGERERGLREVIEVAGVGGAEDGRGNAGAVGSVAQVSVQAERSGR